MKGILFFDNGEYVNVDFSFKKNIDTSTQYHRTKLEKKIVNGWNATQPHAVHKVTKCHLLRN